MTSRRRRPSRLRKGIGVTCAWALLAVCSSETASAQSSWGDTVGVTTKVVWGAVGWLGEWAGVSDMCPFTTDFSEVANRAVRSKVRCQDRALDAITKALSAWEMNLMSKHPKPLVLAFTGPTGVGKTETAHVLARAMLTKTEIIGKAKHPRGLLVLRGEDFSDVAANVTTYVETIKSAVFKHVSRCQGHAVVLFDEVQKVVPGTLDALTQAISEHPVITIYKDGNLLAHDTSHVAFFFVSDIGWMEMMTELLKYKTLDEVPEHRLTSVVKKAMDEQWERLKCAKLVDTVVPFLPLTKDNMREIIDLKLQEMSEEMSGRTWSRLETTPELRDQLVESPYVKYTRYELAPAEGSEDEGAHVEESEASGKSFAEFGARNLYIDGPLQALESAMVVNMKPWRTNDVLDVRYNRGTSNVELRWCPPEIRPGEAVGCELRWTGDLKTSIK